jgi:hypothetical protein
MNVEIKKDFYSIKECKKNLEKLYVFGDNEAKYGNSGQACIRDISNSIGLATKKDPSKYWSDDDYFENIKSIDSDIFSIKESYINDMYEAVVFPIKGLGTGLSNMQEKCPRTFLYLCERLLNEFGFNNLNSLK